MNGIHDLCPSSRSSNCKNKKHTSGWWGLGGTNLPLGDELQDRFPLVGRYCDDTGQIPASGLSPDQVSTALEGVFS